MVKDLWPSTRASLIERLADQQDQSAWQLIIDIYAPPVLQYCLARGLQRADALDASQEVLTKLKDFEYHPERGKFRAWLGTVTRNQVNLYWRRKQPHNQLVEPDRLTGNSDVNWDQISRAHILDAALRRVRPEFTERQWRAFEQLALSVQNDDDQKRYVWQRNTQPAEVASSLGCSVEWIYKTKSVILRRLREEVVYLAHELTIID